MMKNLTQEKGYGILLNRSILNIKKKSSHFTAIDFSLSITVANNRSCRAFITGTRFDESIPIRSCEIITSKLLLAAFAVINAQAQPHRERERAETDDTLRDTASYLRA